MPRLHEIAKVLRSKNAGPFCLTLDVMFEDEATYKTVRDEEVLTPDVIAPLYQLNPKDVVVIYFDPAWAVKVSMPRIPPSGDPSDSDVLGCQLHKPIFYLNVRASSTKGGVESR